jgi:hypothetical protein
VDVDGDPRRVHAELGAAEGGGEHGLTIVTKPACAQNVELAA